MAYNETLDYLYQRLPMFQRIGPQAFKKDLTNIIKLMSSLNDVHQNVKMIHVAGTNGKGSVTHILAALLMGAGLKVGMYTSPHYRDFRERIKINGELIAKRAVTTFVQKNKVSIENIKASFFEVTVAMAFDYFAKEKVDVAIIETGLGGRLDSTNIITPLLSVITNISLDHQRMLGDTLAQIALEKAGIIKSKVPVLIGEVQAEIISVFTSRAEVIQAPLYLAEKINPIKIRKSDYRGIEGEVKVDDSWISFKTDISGSYQEKNLQTSIAAFDLLKDNFGLPVIDFSWLLNIRSRTHFIGRYTVLGEEPLIIADSAHNVAGLKILKATINKISYKNLFIILGTVNDKDPSYIFKILPKEAFYHFAKANIPRGLEAKKLKELAEANSVKGQEYSSVRRALAAAKRKAKAHDLIVIAGSIFVVAEVV